MATHSISTYERRVDLETLTGIKPIESAYDQYERVMIYRNGARWAKMELPTKEESIGYDKWLDYEEAFCNKAFK